MKNWFIRVTKVNNTQQGVVEYRIDDILERLDGLCELALIYEHVEDCVPHFHIVIKDGVSNFYEIKKALPHGDIQEARVLEACVRYCFHDTMGANILKIGEAYKNNVNIKECLEVF